MAGERPVSRGLWVVLALLVLVPRFALVTLNLGRAYSGDELSYNQIRGPRGV